VTAARIHPTAIVEADVFIGDGSAIWDNVHIRHGARIGHHTIVGEKSYLAYDAQIGNFVKINAFVYICAGVTIEDGAMISAGTVFTNDRNPRAANADLTALRSSDPDENTLLTVVARGATIGAHCTIGPGVSIGRFAMVGMGSLVTRQVPDYHLVHGHPARSMGCVCRCGEVLERFDGHTNAHRNGHSDGHSDGHTNGSSVARRVQCSRCGLRYEIAGQAVTEIGVVV
jgi:UDP-2-acetamido-3-amino-2,3-dideoxy-glucuronate N-acetyltransferase